MRLRIWELMEEHGWKQAELAERSGLDQGSISKLANGRKKFRQSHIEALVRAFGVSPCELFEGERQDFLHRAIMRQFDRLPQAEQERALEQLRFHADHYGQPAAPEQTPETRRPPRR